MSIIGALGSSRHLHGMAFGEDIAVGDTVMNLHMLNGTEQSGAVCLDGTPGGFYFSAATNAANKDDWQIYFQGGGWYVSWCHQWNEPGRKIASSSHPPCRQVLR